MILRIVLFVASLFLAHASEIDLNRFEKSIYSQNGEDGVLAKIFQLIDPSSKYCVELGSGNGLTNSTTLLLRKQRWKCLLLDKMYENSEFNLRQEFITAENVNKLFENYQVPLDLDLLSISMDYNDFYIWQALDEKYTPTVVVIEYNATHLPDEDKVVKYHPFYCGDGTNYFGASIRALYNLGRSKGYSLVYAEKTGRQLFFVRDNLLKMKNLKFVHVNDVEALYRRPNYGNGPNGGYPQDKRNRAFVSSAELLQ